MKPRSYLWSLAVLVAVVAGLPVAASAVDQTAVAVSTNRTTYSAGMTAEITVQVVHGNNQDLTVTYAANGQTVQLGCGAISVNDDVFTCQAAVYWNTKITATIGDATSSKSLLVRPKMATYAASPRAYQSTTALYYKGDQPVFTSTVLPARATMCIRHEVQVKRASGWSPLLTGGCKYPDKNGYVAWRWYGSHPAGYAFRVRATFGGDALNVSGPGSWANLRFVAH